MKVRLTHTAYASTAHRYWNTAWSAEQNTKTYGADASEQGVGSNLRLDLSDSDELAGLKAKVDHQCLFFEHASSLEQITEDLAKGLKSWSALRVWESDRLSCRIERQGAMSLEIRVDNLTLELGGPRDPVSGLIANRALVFEAVSEARSKFLNREAIELEKWGEMLFHDLQKNLKALKTLRVDLGRHEYVHLRA